VDGDGRVRVWDAASWNQVAILAGHARAARAVAFSPDSRWLATTGQDSVPRIWDLSAQRPPIELRGHTATSLAIGFTRDGARIFTTSLDGTLRFWDAATGRELNKIIRGGDVSAAALTPDERRLIVSGLGDPALAVFDLTTNELLMTLRGHTAPVSSLAVSPDGLTIASSGNDRTVRLWRAATASDVAAWTSQDALSRLAAGRRR
jgi:WD40 repeat protein